MSTIMIGIDPNEATHTAVAIDEGEVVLGEFRVRAPTVDRLGPHALSDRLAEGRTR